MLDRILLEHEGIVNLEPRSILETNQDSILTNVAANGAANIGEHESNVLGHVLGEDGGQGGQCIVYADRAARNGAIGEDENGSDGVDMVLDLRFKTLLVEFILLDSASVDQRRGVEDANLGRKMLTHTHHVRRH